MQEIKIGDIVILHLSDGSVTTNIVVNVISLTEVQLINLSTSSLLFDASTAPIYKHGTQPGEWELMNEEPQEEFKNFREVLQLVDHPMTRVLRSLLNIKLSPDLEEVFANIGRIYADNNMGSPFYEVSHRSGLFNNNDYFYNLVTMGVQEGLRSTFYSLQQFLNLAEVVKVQGAAIVTDIKPSHNGTFGINAQALNAHYESFVVLSRATLDRLNYFLKYYFQIKNNNPGLYQLRDNLERMYGNDQRVIQLVEVMKKHTTYLDTQFKGSDGQPTERNRLAHQEYIGFTTP